MTNVAPTRDRASRGLRVEECQKVIHRLFRCESNNGGGIQFQTVNEGGGEFWLKRWRESLGVGSFDRKKKDWF